MSYLIAVTYPDEATARQVREVLIEQTKAHTLELADLVIVTQNQDGKVKLHQSHNLAGAGAAGGALWGGLIGLLFLAPLVGMAIGAAAGATSGALADIGVDNKFMKELGAKLTPGAAAVIVLARNITPDKVLPAIAQFGGDVLHTSLSSDAEENLQAALDDDAAGN